MENKWVGGLRLWKRATYLDLTFLVNKIGDGSPLYWLSFRIYPGLAFSETYPNKCLHHQRKKPPFLGSKSPSWNMDSACCRLCSRVESDKTRRTTLRIHLRWLFRLSPCPLNKQKRLDIRKLNGNRSGKRKRKSYTENWVHGWRNGKKPGCTHGRLETDCFVLPERKVSHRIWIKYVLGALRNVKKGSEHFFREYCNIFHQHHQEMRCSRCEMWTTNIR